MSIHTQTSKPDTLNIRVDSRLKADFVRAANTENRPISEVLRDLISSYVHTHERKEFEAEARRQSALVAASFDEKETMRWFEGTWEMDDWR